MKTVAEDLRQRYAEALAAIFGPSGECYGSNPLHCECGPHAGVPAKFDRLADAVLAVRDEELGRLREENATLLIGADPSRMAAGKRIVDSLTRLVRIELDDARADRDRWRERAETAERRLAAIRKYISEDFRFWCSPLGVAKQYADALVDFIDREDPDRG
ncbi:hypothetical protein [Nonomuraea sp. NPDC049400]|uniref:hypothetical protein n=1 Tax=Nonomuraea sp. NPDC049400 TaxID=3364352 RepID=UPI0037BC6FE0